MVRPKKQAFFLRAIGKVLQSNRKPDVRSETVNEFAELRRLADENLQVAAAKIGVSSTKLWNFENGRANSVLTDDQKATLCRHYGRLISKRLARVSRLLVVEGATKGN